MATFTKRNATWRAQVRKKGVVKSKSFRTKAEAVAWANRTEMEIDTGSYSEIVDIPFSEVIDRYLREITPTKRGARKETLMLYRFLKFPITQKSLKELRENQRQNRPTRFSQ